MPTTFDPRLAELRVLENLADQTWANGVCALYAAGQSEALGMSQTMYADLLLTLFEDGLLYPENDGLRNELKAYEWNKNISLRHETVLLLAISPTFSAVRVTYRGRRRIEELREQLRRDRILERFGILIDGRYIVSDLIYLLERSNGEPVSVLFGDVDDFKRFNTDHGYKAGDEVLRHVFRAARQIVGNRGDVYRRGGEEIVAMLPYCGVGASQNLAEQLRGEVESKPVAFEDKSLHVSLSIGVATSPPCDPDGPALETHAEIALKRAKSEGKNCVRIAEHRA